MKKLFMGRVTGLVSLFMVLFLVIQSMMQTYTSRKHFYQSADLSINQINDILKRNEEEEASLRDSLKNDYIIRAQACSYIIENSNLSEQDVREMKKIAGLLEVDEIHLFNLDGSIYAGTNPEYYGYNFDTGEQIGFFRPMLSNEHLSLCQDVTPNTAEGKMMMYAMVWREDRKGLIQIGLTPTRLLEEMERNNISSMLSKVPTNDNVYFVADHETGEIVECTQDVYQGRNLEDIGIGRSSFSETQVSHFRVDLEQTGYLAAFEICGEYEIGICRTERDVYSGAYLASLIVFVYLLLASAAIVLIINFMTRKERQREAEHQEQMKQALVQANAANEAKSVFLASMSHDIRTPMNAIIGFTDLLEKHADNAERRNDYIQKIKTSGRYLLELLSNILEMARIESGQAVIDERVWSIQQFDNVLSSVFKEEVSRKKLTLRKEIHVEHPYIWCDSAKLQEIYLNLVSNAVKYTPEGGTISMRLDELPCDKEGYVLHKTVIEDTGIGMSKEFLPFLFDEFTREQDTTQCKINGTGLGMPITKKLVELMGGSIAVESEPGVGTRFTVMIPFRTADVDNQSPEEAYERALGAAEDEFRGKRILLTEDNDLNAEIATEILEEIGFAVERARDGAICVDMLRKAELGYYDLILMDVQMPNMNGYQAAEAIRKLPDRRRDIPIIAMTANAFQEDKELALEAGMNGHIAKPVDLIKLIEKLAEVLKKR